MKAVRFDRLTSGFSGGVLLAAWPAQAAPADALLDPRVDLGGFSPLLAGALGFSTLITLIALWMLIHRPRIAARTDDDMPIAMPDLRAVPPSTPERQSRWLSGQQQDAPSSGMAASSVRLSEAVAAARARMAINEENERRSGED
jgi:hypothetical protein